MAEELTLLQVLDSAVKIGLGAGITAVSGYFVLKRTQRGQVAAEYREEKRKTIGELTEVIGIVSHRALDYWSYISDRALNKARGVAFPPDIEARVLESHRLFYASFERITTIEGKYFVVAGNDKYRQLVEYAQLLASFHAEGALGQVQDLPKWPSREKVAREALLESIKSVYEQEIA